MAQGKRVAGRPGTSFINLGDWAAQNQSGSQRLAEQLASGVESEGMGAEQGLRALDGNFSEAVGAGSLQYQGDPMSAERATALGQRGYTGPDALSDMAGYESAMSAADRAGQNARRLGDVYGRATALQDMAGGRDYSSGEQMLDSTLAGRVGGSRFAQLGQQWGGLMGRAQSLERAASGAAREARASTDDAARQYATQAPVLQQQEDKSRQEWEAQAQRDMEQRQDEWDRAHPEADGEDNRHLPRNRAREPGGKTAISGWGGRGGSWA